MSETERPARPRQLTMAIGFVIGGSIFLVLSVFDAVTGLRSVDMREGIAEVLSSPTGEGLGISVDDATELMRIGLMVAGACAAAAAVLGFYVLQGSRPARIALSVLAVPILLTAPLTGGLMGALVAMAILMLWSGPARDWFAGRPIREPAAPPAAPPRSAGPPPAASPPQGSTEGRPVPPASSLSAVVSSDQPRATSGFGQVPPGPAAAQGPVWSPSSSPVVQGRSTPPAGVKLACVLTWVFSGMVALLYLGMLVALIAAQDRMVDLLVETPEWQRANLEEDMIVPALWFGCLMFLGWALGACVLAWFTWRRHNWARWLLVASAGGTVLVALFAFPVGLLHQLAAALTIGGLVGSAARQWFAGPSAPSGPAGSPPGQHQWPHQGQHPGQDQGQGYPQGSQAPEYPQGPQGQDYPQDYPQGQDQPVPPGGKPPVW